MKKLATLLLAAAMLVGGVPGAEAIDWKVRGEWRMEFGLFDGMGVTNHVPGRGTRWNQLNANQQAANQQWAGTKRNKQYGAGRGRDNFQAGQRVDLWLDAVASENLSGSLRLEIGGNRWGTAGTNGDRSNNGALGQRGVSIGVRNAYLDWFVPQTELKIRMGIQPLATPGYAFGASVYGQDAAGITASYKFNENVSLTAFWIRPYNDNWANGDGAAWSQDDQSNAFDNVDVFGLLVPLSFDGFKVTPWGMIAAIGPNALRQNGLNGTALNEWNQQVTYGVLPAYYDSANRRLRDQGRLAKQYATAWWGGLTFDITAADPFRFAFDGVYGSVQYPDAGYLNRRGWFLAALAEYKLDWGVPGIVGWWGSGDDSNPANGSERMPILDTSTAATSFSSMAMYGGWLTPNGGIDGTNVLGVQSFVGTWGIGVRIRDMSFIEDLKHTFRVNLFGGTNAPAMAKYMTGKKVKGDPATWNAHRTRAGQTDFNNGAGGHVYLTTQDYGIEVNLDNSYKIYENLEMILELGYMHLWLDTSRSVWGRGSTAGTNLNNIRGVSTTDAWKAALYFRYTF
jgi:hypothetical protein